MLNKKRNQKREAQEQQQLKEDVDNCQAEMLPILKKYNLGMIVTYRHFNSGRAPIAGEISYVRVIPEESAKDRSPTPRADQGRGGGGGGKVD